MSFDLFVARYEDGRTVSLPVTAFDQVFRPYVLPDGQEDGFWSVRAADGSEGDVYADVVPGSFEDIMVNHAGDGVIGLLIEFARQAGGVVFSSFGPTLLTAENQRGDLPAGDQADAVVIRSAEEMSQTLQDWMLAHPEDF
jgi:hypothetical protein